jgi:hypothetical protein
MIIKQVLTTKCEGGTDVESAILSLIAAFFFRVIVMNVILANNLYLSAKIADG